MSEKGHTQLKGVVLLMLTAFIWGSSFVAQSVGMENVEAFTFNGIRTLLGAAVLLPFALARTLGSRKTHKRATYPEIKKVIINGAVLGVILCAASNFQQFAFYYSTSGKIAFITAMYMFFVPLLGLFTGKRVPLITWLCVLGGFAGLYFLCINPSDLGNINKGDILSLVCALLFAVHILMIEKYSPDSDGIALSFTQFTVSGVISCILMFIFESPSLPEIRAAALPIMYSGFLSCGLAYTFQIIGQKYTESTVASLIMCMESVFAVIASAIVFRKLMSPRETIGCVLMFAAIIVSQLTADMKGDKRNARNSRT